MRRKWVHKPRGPMGDNSKSISVRMTEEQYQRLLQYPGGVRVPPAGRRYPGGQAESPRRSGVPAAKAVRLKCWTFRAVESIVPLQCSERFDEKKEGCMKQSICIYLFQRKTYLIRTLSRFGRSSRDHRSQIGEKCKLCFALWKYFFLERHYTSNIDNLDLPRAGHQKRLTIKSQA